MWRQVLGIAYLESRWVRRQPLWLVQGLVGTIGFTIIIYVWGSLNALRNLILAYVVAGAWGLGLNIVAQTIGWDRQNRRLEHLVASPVTLPAYFLGVVLGCNPFLATQVLPALAIALLLGLDPFPLLALIPVAALALLLGAFLSLSILLRIRNPTNISAITNPLYTFTITLPPVYYPLIILPPPMRLPALAVPTVALMEAARWLTGYAPTACEPAWTLASLATWMTITALIVARRFKWGLE